MSGLIEHVTRRKPGTIGIVIGGPRLRAAQHVDGRLVTADVPAGGPLGRCLRQLLSAAPFVGRDVAVGIEGEGVLIESFPVPPGGRSDLRRLCADRLKGDPLFDGQRALIGATLVGAPSGDAGAGGSLAILAALDRQRLDEYTQAWRELELNVLVVEPAALAGWRAWSGEGLQVRLVGTDGFATLMVGQDEHLMFCRVLKDPVAGEELRQSLGRAASLLGVDGLERIDVVGFDEEPAGLDGLTVNASARGGDDVLASGLATEGTRLVDFTPPEERVLREKRRVRRVALGLAGCCVAGVLLTGLFGVHRVSALEQRRDTLQQQRDELDHDRRELTGLQAELARARANEAIIQRARPGHRLSTLVELLARHAGDDISLESATIADVPDARRARRAADEGAQPRLLEIQLHGLSRKSLAVRRYADGLLATGAFADVRVEASERVLLGIGVEGERFRIHATAETH